MPNDYGAWSSAFGGGHTDIEPTTQGRAFHQGKTFINDRFKGGLKAYTREELTPDALEQEGIKACFQRYIYIDLASAARRFDDKQAEQILYDQMLGAQTAEELIKAAEEILALLKPHFDNVGKQAKLISLYSQHGYIREMRLEITPSHGVG